VSVWDNYQGSTRLPPGTPQIEIHPTATGAAVVINGQQPPAHTGQYTECHRWVQNTYRLTSTMMLPVFDAYASLLGEVQATTSQSNPTPPEVPPVIQNKYRKAGK
jgi:hypothetical protein